jgi:polyketide biosynthesis acyl carrier protein
MDEQLIFQAIQRNVLAVLPDLPVEAITAARSLSELGLNSIDRTEVIILTMEELGISVPVHEFRRGDSITGLIAVMRRHT